VGGGRRAERRREERKDNLQKRKAIEIPADLAAGDREGFGQLVDRDGARGERADRLHQAVGLAVALGLSAHAMGNLAELEEESEPAGWSSPLLAQRAASEGPRWTRAVGADQPAAQKN
jgi:hypothetical protein